MKPTLLTKILTLTLGIAPFASVHAEHYKLFLLTGQSNSLGTTNGGEADPTSGSDPADQHIKFAWHNVVSSSQSIGHSGSTLAPATSTADFTTLQDQQGGVYGGSATHWGPEVDFSRNLYKAGVRNFGVIKASRGGGGNTNWHKASGGHMYSHLLNTVNEATASLTSDGHTYEISGLLYLQGESDSTAEAAAAGTRFKELVDNLRVDLTNASSLHGLIGSIASSGTDADTTRTNQKATADSTAYINYFSNVDQAANVASDNLHFNKQAKLTIGQRFANEAFTAGLVSRHYGKLVFIGDSITQGGNGDHPSYRYQVFTNLANLNVAQNASAGYEFVGSQTGPYNNSTITAPDVNGQTFVNKHDGHWGWRGFWENARVALPGGRYNTNNLGNGTLLNWTGQSTTYETSNAGTLTYTGDTYIPDTVVMKIGINDTSTSSATQIRDDIGTMIDQLRAANANVRVHLCQVLYSNNVAFSTVDSLNALLPALVDSKNSASATSPVWLIDVNNGFDPTTMTYDNTHPNSIGEEYVGERVSGGIALIEMPIVVVAPGITQLSDEEKASSRLGLTSFEGSDIWNTGSFASGWSQLGSITPSGAGSSDLSLEYAGSSASMLEGTSSGWSDINDGDWTFETRLKFDANPNGYMLWLGTGTNRILIEVHANRTQDFGGNTFNVAHDNVDGQYHTFNVTHDASAGVYHVSRDGVLLTAAAGVGYDLAGSDERLLLGDYTGGTFGNNFDVTIDYIDYGISLSEGNHIYDGATLVNDWTTTGGVTPTLVDGSDLQIVNTTNGGSWLQETTNWATQNDGYYTFETRIKFDANPNGFIVWLENGEKSVIFEIHGNRTQDFGGQSFNVSHDNLDGNFHIYRVGYDAFNEVYHVWRDGVRITPTAGAATDATSSNERIILGDYTGGSFGNGFDTTIDYIRTDSGNAYQPTATSSVNTAPVFVANPTSTTNATEAAVYSATLSASATDSDVGDTVSYSKVSGPAWLTIATDGALSGTPSTSDVGANVFTILASDGNGGEANATVNITVDPVISLLFSDDFERSAGSTIANGWVEQTNDSRIYNTNRTATQMLISVSSGVEYAVVNQLSNTFVTGERYELTWNGTRAASASGTLVYDASIGTWDGSTFTPLATQDGTMSNITINAKQNGPTVYATATAAQDGQQIAIRFETVDGSSAWAGFDDIELNKIDSNVAPVFTDSSTTFGEDISVGAVVITAAATDADSNDTQTFAITAGNTGSAFAIDTTSGDITTTTGLDFETTSSYSLTVSVTDAGGLSDTATLTLYVTDVIETHQGSATKLARTSVNAVSSAAWTTVNLGSTYTSAVIVTTPIYADSTQVPVVTRVRNVSRSSFELTIERTDGLVGDVACDVSILAVEEGVYTVANDGVNMEAVKFNSTVTDRQGSWTAEARTYANTYTTPVVLGQVMSANDSNWSTFWSMGASRTDAADASNLNVGKHVAEDSITARSDETIGYIVIESGSGSINGSAFEAALGANLPEGVDETTTGWDYALTGNLTAANGAVVSQAGMTDDDGSWAVLYGATPFTTTTLTLAIDEDQITDAERSHSAEQVGYIIFE